MVARRLALALAVAAGLAACGKKGDPMPPPRLIPAPIGDLRVQQTGSELVLSMTYPAVTTGGLALESLQSIEILALRPPVAPGGVTPSLDPRTFEATAPVAKKLDGAELVAATRGAELVLELDAAPGSTFGPRPAAPPGAPAPAPSTEASPAEVEEVAPAAEPAAEPTDTAPITPPSPVDTAAVTAPSTMEARAAPPLLIAVRTIGPRGHSSPLSNVVSIAPRDPPPAPASLAAEPTATGVHLEWTASSPEAVGFDVLRRRAGEGSFGAPIAQLGTEAQTYVDATAGFGVDYEYAVRAVAARDPLIESVDSPVRGVEYRDVFPPPAPSNLVALAEAGRIRLLWDRVDATDLAGYRVYRAEDGAAPIELPREPGAGTGHTDVGVRAGATYVYRVTAVDHDDNESAPSEPATATPR